MKTVLTTAANVGCGHQGTATLTSTAKLTVGGQPVLLQNAASSWVIAGCTQTKTNASEVPCASILGVTAGTSNKLTVGGVAVLTDELGGSTNGKPDGESLSGSDSSSHLQVAS